MLDEATDAAGKDAHKIPSSKKQAPNKFQVPIFKPFRFCLLELIWYLDFGIWNLILYLFHFLHYFFFPFAGEITERGLAVVKKQLDLAGGAVTVLFDENVRDMRPFGVADFVLL